jgi:hypothetical protein
MKAPQALRAGTLPIVLCLLLGAGLLGNASPAMGRTKTPVEMGDPDDTGNAGTLPRSNQAPKQTAASLRVVPYSARPSQREALTMLVSLVRVHFFWIRTP